MTSMLLAVAQVGVTLAVACGQGWLLVAPRRDARFDATNVCLAILAGLATSIIVLYSAIDLIGRAVFVVPIVLGVAGWLRFGVDALRAMRSGVTDPRVSAVSAICFALIAAIMLAAVVRLEYPLGHDLVFHSFLTDKIIESGRLPGDWKPWAPISVNYTLGLHLVAAFLARWTGLTAPRVFEALHFWLGLLTLAPLYLVARRFLSEARGALAVVALWTFCANYGSFFSYFAWGGLPTVLSQAFFLGAILLLADEDRMPRASLLAGALLAALVMVSHLGAVIAAWVLGAYVIVALIVPAERESARFLLTSVLWQAVLAAPFLFHYVRKMATIMTTRALRYGDDPPLSLDDVVRSIGLPLLPILVIGVIAAVKSPRSVRNRLLLGVWIVALVAGLVFWDRIYRWYSLATTDVAFAAFTPGRFLTVASYPLAILAAAWVGSDLLRARPRVRAAAAALAFIACVAGFALYATPALRAQSIASDRVRLYEWVRASTPEDAFVLYDIPLENGWWRYYVVRRMTCNPPIPASEPTNESVFLEMAEICGARDPARLRAWLAREGIPGYLVVEAGSLPQRRPGAFDLVTQNGAYAILRFRT